MIGKGILMSSAIALGALFAGGAHDCGGFVEDNDLWIPSHEAGVKVMTGIDEATYHDVLDRIQDIYGPDFAARGKRLVIRRPWSDGTVNAFAQQSFFNQWLVTFPGGLPRHRTITADGFALVACHEIGHHIGGFPLNFWPRMSVEGQADYFANTKCLRHFFTPETNKQFFANNDVDEYAAAACESHFGDENEWMTCVRASMAGMSVANLFRELRNESIPARFETPSQERVSSTNTRHPGTQCRLDTYFQGSLCTINKNVPFSFNNEEDGACTAKQGYETGTRPLCWFAPRR